ncbi:MAG: hypothetical protein JJ885_02080 [Muricauda sp.]|jgi:hypothetical protein|nr:hypothetical protein [Allomuricauda sp.]MBO6587929.1 hypothetical protein [Allomuricauda sp.]MBO6617554.1 hypothetical protein [Allomuricauda sp.]MBO6643435.1 hypothetical protein [Allomuricauda sp.]MBO6745889.1 hypothetical protein [Allomuricauda sp.]
MMDLKKIMLYVMVPVVIISCWPKDLEETGIIVVNNGLDNDVQMRFFRNSIPSGPEILSKTGKGEIFRGQDTSTVVVINQTLQADSIVLTFDNERTETHFLYTTEPKGHSLFINDSYVHNGNISTYTIDAKNYNNATPCDGPCN